MTEKCKKCKTSPIADIVFFSTMFKFLMWAQYSVLNICIGIINEKKYCCYQQGAER